MAKIRNILVVLSALVVFGAIFANVASAECGPGFTNKKQLIRYYKSNPSAAQGFRKWLLANKAYTGYQADETVINWLRSPEQRVFKAPRGYRLKKNTYCPGGPGKYRSYHGKLGNMPGKVMLWHCAKRKWVTKCVPILKGYCMNAVKGPPIKKKHRKCKCRKHKHPKHKRPKSCEAKGLKTGPAGSCVQQIVTVTPKQECEANNHSGTDCQQTTITIVNNCGNVNVGNSGDVGNGGNCQTGGEQTCVGEDNCNTESPPCCSPPPCEKCEPAPKSPPEIAIEAINDFETNEKTVICGRVTAPAGDNVSVTFFAENGGEFANHGVATLRSGTTNEWCSKYTAPSEVPPGGCDIIKAVVQDNTTHLSGKDEKKAPIKAETPF